MSEIEISGLEELKEKLDELCTKGCKAVVREGLKAGGEVLIESIAAVGAGAPGEVGEYLGDPDSWKSSTRVTTSAGGESGVTKIQPWTALPEWHVGSGAKFMGWVKGKKGMRKKFHGQAAGRRYQRYLAYLVKLMEGGGMDQARNLGNEKPLTEGFQAGAGKAVDAFVEKCKEALGLD